MTSSDIASAVPSTADRVFELAHVGFSYRREPVLTDISLEIQTGEFVCVVGANGSGKTTLVKLMAGLLAVDRGDVRCFGENPATGARERLARRLSYLPQEYRLSFPFRVFEVVLMGRYAHGSPHRLESRSDIEASVAAMRRCDVEHLSDRRFNELSGGECRRVLLAQAFSQGTESLLLDEPTAALDPAHAISVFQALQQECDTRGATVVTVTHDVNLAARFAKRVILLHEGQIIADDTPVRVFSSSATTRAFDISMHVGVLPDSGATFVVPRS